MVIRSATSDDVPAMTKLVEAERTRYATWQPVMWCKAPDSTQKTLEWFPHLIDSTEIISLVSENHSQIDGFLIAFQQRPPPIYSPGLTYMIDDFCLADDTLWPTIGQELLLAAFKAVKATGAKQCLSICPVAHNEKAKLLRFAGLIPASSWSTITL